MLGLFTPFDPFAPPLDHLAWSRPPPRPHSSQGVTELPLRPEPEREAVLTGPISSSAITAFDQTASEVAAEPRLRLSCASRDLQRRRGLEALRAPSAGRSLEAFAAAARQAVGVPPPSFSRCVRRVVVSTRSERGIVGRHFSNWLVVAHTLAVSQSAVSTDSLTLSDSHGSRQF